MSASSHMQMASGHRWLEPTVAHTPKQVTP